MNILLFHWRQKHIKLICRERGVLSQRNISKVSNKTINNTGLILLQMLQKSLNRHIKVKYTMQQK